MINWLPQLLLVYFLSINWSINSFNFNYLEVNEQESEYNNSHK